MHDKLTSGRVEIVIFGEISTGKSALINALVGRDVASVDVRGGWTREVWHVAWDGTGYTLPGLGESQVVLVDTPGINEVGGGPRGEMAREAAQRSDLVLFVTDSDLNETEHTALVELAAFHKPLIVVLNKIDLYSREQRERLLERHPPRAAAMASSRRARRHGRRRSARAGIHHSSRRWQRAERVAHAAARRGGAQVAHSWSCSIAKGCR